MTEQLRAIMSSVERTGVWSVPSTLDIRLFWGSALLDFREAVLQPGVTTIDVRVKMANLEVIVPPGMAVDVHVSSVAGNVATDVQTPGVSDRPRLRFIGQVKFGNLEVTTRAPGETARDAQCRERNHFGQSRDERRRRWHELHAERDLWRRAAHDRHHRDRAKWMPWWLQARMRLRIFSVMALALAVGVLVGYRVHDQPRWWYALIAFFMLSAVSGAVAWRLTRPLIMVVKAARDIGDGKLDTRIDVGHQGGEMQLLATAINEMAARIEQQMKDQRTLLAAVSHELRTPLGHMRVLIETARDASSPRALDELDREILVLDDLVGRLLASSRLEFGNLDRRQANLGELATDVATSSGIAPELIEAIGDVAAPVDLTLIRRAIANLIDNARHHGGGATALRIERRGGQVAIEVDDAGPGVPADRRADAFRAFVPSNGGGLGLGLALVSRIAVAHGGGAWISDRPGGGARIGFAVAVA